jgi:hypothetical protein
MSNGRKYEDLSLEEKIQLGAQQAKALTDQLREACYAFDFVRDVTRDVLQAGLDTLTESDRLRYEDFEEDLSSLVVRTVYFDAFLSNVYTKPMTPTHPPAKLERDPDRDAIHAELLKVNRCVVDATEEIRSLAGEQRDYYTGELLRAAAILAKLLEPFASADGNGDPN